MSSILDDLFRFPSHPSAGRDLVKHILGRLPVPALVVDTRLHVHLANLQGREMFLKLQPEPDGGRRRKRLSGFPPYVKDDVKSCLKSGKALVRSGFEIEALHRRPLDLVMCPGRIEDKDLCFIILLRPGLGEDSGIERAFDRLMASFDVAAVFVDSELRVQKFNDPYLVAFARTAEEIRGVRVSDLEMGEQAKVLESQIRHLMEAGEARRARADALPTAKMGVVSSPLTAWPFYARDGECRGFVALMEPKPIASSGIGADDVKQRFSGQVVELMRSAVVVTHLDGRILVMNGNARALVKPGTEIGRTNLKSAIPWSHPEIIQGLIDDIRKGLGYSAVLTDTDTPAGKRLLKIRAFGITELGPITSEIVFLLEDVTEEEKVRNLLSETARGLADEKAVLESMLRSVGATFTVIDRELNILRVNEAAAALLKMAPEEIVGKKLTDIHPYMRKTGVLDYVRAAVDEKREVHMPRFMHVTRENVEIPLKLSVIPATVDGVEACIAISEIVGMGEEAAGEMAEKALRYEMLLNNVQDGVVIYDKDLRIVDGNHVLVEMARAAGDEFADITIQDLVGVYIGDVMNLEQRDLILDYLRRAAESDKPYRTGPLRVSSRETGAEHFIDINFLPLRPGEGPSGGVMGIARFSTKEKQLERELEEYTTNLEEVVKDRTHELASANTLLGATVKRLESMAKSGMVLSTLKDIESVMTSFLRGAREVLAADFVSVALVENASAASKTTYYSSGTPPPSQAIPTEVVEVGLSRLLLGVGQPSEVRLHSPNVLTVDFGVGQYHALLLAWKAEGEFTSIDKNLSGLLCTQLSFSMPITKYVNDLRRERDRSQCLRQIAFRAAGMASVSGAIRIVAEEISATVPADRFFWLISKNDTEVWVSEVYTVAGAVRRGARRVCDDDSDCLGSVLEACRDSHKLFCDRFPRFGASDFRPGIRGDESPPCPFASEDRGEDLTRCMKALLRSAGLLGEYEGSLAVAPVTLSRQSWGILCACSDVGARFSREDSCFMCLAAATVGHMWQAADTASSMRRLEDAGETVSELAHDLKYPLMRLKESISNVRCCDEAHALADPGLEGIAGEVERLSLLAEELIDISSAGSHKYEIIDVSEVLDHCISLTSSDLGARSVKVERRGDTSDLPAIFANRKDLKAVFLNVLINCIDAAGEQGAVTVDIKRDGARVDAEAVSIVFTDTGPGVSEADMARIFDPFYSGKDGGSGLGLFSAKKRANANGGDVICEMGSDGKSQFVIWFPLASG